jgi:hypothetical protein
MDRKLINEICKWGWARLVRDIPDTGFSFAESLSHRMMDDGHASSTDLRLQKKSEFSRRN